MAGRQQSERRVVGLPEVAAMLGIHRTTATRLVADGKFPMPTHRLGKKIVVTKAVLDDFFADRSPKAG